MKAPAWLLDFKFVFYKASLSFCKVFLNSRLTFFGNGWSTGKDTVVKTSWESKYDILPLMTLFEKQNCFCGNTFLQFNSISPSPRKWSLSQPTQFTLALVVSSDSCLLQDIAHCWLSWKYLSVDNIKFSVHSFYSSSPSLHILYLWYSAMFQICFSISLFSFVNVLSIKCSKYSVFTAFECPWKLSDAHLNGRNVQTIVLQHFLYSLALIFCTVGSLLGWIKKYPQKKMVAKSQKSWNFRPSSWRST